ncbi:MAG: RdgB/HAM1 family non-canonical purine NTP pyrophosphatase [Chthoniobacterales bacterium]
MQRLLLATRNAHKTREFAEILGAQFVVSDLISVEDVPTVEETGATFEENAVLKAVAASRCVSGLVVSDDSGLEVAALDGAPGVRSARYAGENATDAENVAKLFSELQRLDSASRTCDASFQCVLALAEDGKVLRIFRGTVGGSIIPVKRGQRGFGYDPVFVPNGYTETFAELGDVVKNGLSHRARAIAKLRAYLTG